MAYNNSMPTISRINLKTRDNDFIPITEMKEFNDKLNEVILKFNTYLDESNSSSDAVSVAEKLKEIEYNMYDALVFDENGNIIGFNSTQDANGNSVPLCGPENIDDMLVQLENYYGEFIALMGSDPNADLWKIPLDEYFSNALTKFKDKINSVFANSANAAALESKNSSKMDYTKQAAVSFTKNTIMRLNPDISTYNRSINIFPVRSMTDTVAFEVSEPKKDSLAFNLKFFNGNMYYDFNFILDKGKWYISRDVKLEGNESVTKFNYFFNIYKYTSKSSGKVNYVFCLNTDYPSLDTAYSFEIEGVFVNDYSFNATGLDVAEHNEFYTYNIVENGSEPIYNKVYYVKHKDSYVDPETGETSEREVYVEQTNLLKFEEGTTYYDRIGNFELSNSVDIINYKFDSGLFADNSGEFKLSNDAIVYDNLEYNGGNQLIDVNYEVSEAVDGNTNVDANDWVKNNQKVWLDNSFRMYEIDRDIVNLCTRQVSKVDKRLAVGHNDTYFEIVELGPGEIVNTNNYINGVVSGSYDNVINKNLYDENVEEYRGINVSLGVENERVYKTDIINDPSILKKLLVVTANDGTDYTTAINNYIVKNLSFVDYFTIKVYDRADYENNGMKGSSCDVVIYPDFYSEKETEIEKAKDYALYRRSGEFYISFTINFADSDSDYKCRTLVFRKMVKQEMYMTVTKNTEELVAPEGDWGDFVSLYNIALAINNNGLYYTYAGDIWYHLENPITINTGKKIEFNNNYIFTYDGEKWLCCFKPDTQDEIYISQDGLHWYQLFGSEEYIDDTNEGIDDEKGNYYRIKFARRGLYGFTKYIDNEKTIARTWLTDENGLSELIKPKNERKSNDYIFYMSSDECDWFEYSNGNIYGVRSSNRYEDYLISEYTTNNASTSMKDRYSTGTNKIYSVIIDNYNVNRNIVWLHDGTISWVFSYGGGGKIYKINPNTTDWTSTDITGILVDSYDSLKTINLLSPLWQTDTKLADNCRFISSNDLHSLYYQYSGTGINDGDTSYLDYFVDNVNSRLNYKYHNGTFRASLVSSSDDSDESNKTHFYMSSNNYSDFGYLDNILPELTKESWQKRTKYIDSSYFGDICTHYKNMYFGCIANRTNYAINTTPTYNEQEKSATCFVIPCVDGKIYYLSNFSNNSYDNFKPARLASKQKISNITEIDKQNIVSVDSDVQNKAINKDIDNSLVVINVAESFNSSINFSIFKDKTDKIIFSTNPNNSTDNVIEDFKLCIDRYNSLSELENSISVVPPIWSGINSVDAKFYIFKNTGYNKPIVFFTRSPSSSYNYVDMWDLVNGTYNGYLEKTLPIIPIDGFETKDGVFIYGYDSEKEKISVIFHDKNDWSEETGFNWKTVLTVDYIDYIKAHNDDIYVSTFDKDNPYDRYLWNGKTHTFDKLIVMDIKDLYSFTELFEREDGTLYFVNGSGHNTEIPDTNCDIYTFSKIYSSAGISKPNITKLNSDNDSYNGSLKEVINDNKYKTITQFSVDNDRDLICFSKNSESSPEYYYLIDFNKKTITDINIDLTEDTINGTKKFIFDIINIIKNNDNAPLIVQKSAYTSKSINIKDVDKLENIDFRKDEYYLDNKVDVFENNAIKSIYSADTIASGITINSNDYYLVMKISDNNELGVFNAIYSGIIRVIKGKFVVSSGGYNGEINIDKEYLDIKHLKIGVNDNEATLYMAVYGNYPDVVYNRNTGKLDITYDSYLPKEYKILSIPLSTVVKREISSSNEMIFTMEDKFNWDKDNDDIRSQMSEFITTIKHEIEADDVSFRGITEDQDKVYFGYEKSVVHRGIYSLIFYDFNRNCLQFYSPLTHFTELDKNISDDIQNYCKDINPSKYYQVFSNKSYNNYKVDESESPDKVNLLVEYKSPKGDNQFEDDKQLGDTNLILTYDFLNNIVLDRNANKDMFVNSRSDISYNTIQTQYGIFRYTNRENYLENVEYEWEYNQFTRDKSPFNKYGLSYDLERCKKNYLYFTPEGSNKVITIIPSDGGEIEGVIETVEGIFIYQTAYVINDTKMIKGSHLYKMIKIPDNRISEQICTQDEIYFKEMSIQNNQLTDFKDTIDGLFCVGMEALGITSITSTVNSMYTGLINIFMYNGEDFTPIATYNPNDTVNGLGRAVYLPLYIIENKTQTLFVTNNGERLTYVPNTGGVTNISSISNVASDDIVGGTTFISNRTINPLYQSYPVAKPLYSEDGSFYYFTLVKDGAGTDYGKHYDIWIYDADKNMIIDTLYKYPENISEDKLSKIYVPTNLIKYPLVRPALDSSAFKDNIYYTKKFLKKLVERGIPVDRRLKAIGHCIFHNERVLINGIEIQSEGGASNEPKNIRFNIDPDYRINDDMAQYISKDGTIENVTDDSFKKANFTIVLPSKIIDDFNKQDSEENQYKSETILSPITVNWDNLQISRDITTKTYDSEGKLIYENTTTYSTIATADIYGIDEFTDTFKFVLKYRDQDNALVYDTVEYTGNFTEVITGTNAANYNVATTYKYNDKTLAVQNSMDLREKLGFDMTDDGNKMLAALLIGESDESKKARSRCRIGDWIQFKPYTWEKNSGLKYTVALNLRYIVAERILDDHVVFISNDTHSYGNENSNTWTKLIMNNMKQTLFLPVIQEQLGVTPKLYTRMDNVAYLKNELVFFPTEYNVFGAYSYQNSAERPIIGARRWPIFDKTKNPSRGIFNRALTSFNTPSEPYDDWWLATHTNNGSYPASIVSYPGRSDFGIPGYGFLGLTSIGCRPCFAL